MADERADHTWALDTIAALAGVDDDDARAALAACLACDPVVAAAASGALAAGGSSAVAACRAAQADPATAAWAALTLGQIGTDAAIAALWAAAGAPEAETRAAIVVALHRADRADPVRLTWWLADEPDPGVAAVLADLLGRAIERVPPSAVGVLLKRTGPTSPPSLRAIAGWAAAMHDPGAGLVAALALLDEPVVGAILATCVASRGGPLLPLVDGIEIDAQLDLTAPLAPLLGARRDG